MQKFHCILRSRELETQTTLNSDSDYEVRLRQACRVTGKTSMPSAPSLHYYRYWLVSGGFHNLINKNKYKKRLLLPTLPQSVRGRSALHPTASEAKLLICFVSIRFVAFHFVSFKIMCGGLL